MHANLGAAVTQLYRGSRELPASAFPDWALEQAKALVPFDSAIWGRAGMEAGQALIYSVHLHGLPGESLASYARFKDRDVLGAMSFREMGTTLRFSATQIVSDREMLEQHIRRFGLEHSLTTTMVDPRTSLVSFITCFRPESRAPFTEEERQIKQVLAPHLVESCHQSRLLQLASDTQRDHDQSAACDTDFVLVAARSGFAELIRREWPQWSGPRMPPEIRAALAGKTRGRHGVEHIVLSYERVNDLYWLSARERMPFDSLTARQVEIARLTAQGRTHKQIAKTLGLAPATVRNHIDAVYRKLGIGSRAKLATLLSHLD